MLRIPSFLRRKPKSFSLGDATRLVAEGNTANVGRRWAEAEAAYAAALQINPALTAIWVQYGHALKEQGYLRRAEQAYQRAAALNNTLADTHLQLGHVLRLQGETGRAIAAYRAAHLRNPGTQHGRAELSALQADAPDDAGITDAHLVGRVQADDAGSHTPDRQFQQAIRDAAIPTEPTRTWSSYVSLDHVLGAHDLRSEFLEPFDPYFYYNANAAVRAVIRMPSRAACLVHFCEIGLEAVLPFSDTDAFDPDFYLGTYVGGMPFTPGNAYRHWLNVGLRRRAAPNRRRWVASILGDDVQDLDGIDLHLFAAASGPPAEGERWTTLAERFVANVAGSRWMPQPTDANADVLAAIASRLSPPASASQASDAAPAPAPGTSARRRRLKERDPASRTRDAGNADRAFALRQRIALDVPSHRANLLRYADALRERGCFLEAAGIYEEFSLSGSATVGSFVHLAACQERLGKLDQALATLHRGRSAFPGDQGFRRLISGLANRFFGREWNLAVASARLGRVAEAQDRLQRACSTISALGTPAARLPSRVVRSVALVGNQDLAQCRLYRIEQKLEQVEAAGYQAELFDQREGLADFLGAIHRFDAVIFFRVPALPDMISAMEAARELGLATFYEIDDLIFDAAHYPGSLESYGGRISREEHIGLALGVPLFAHALSLCEFGIASTPSLATAMRGRTAGGEVFVHRNALGRRHMAHANTASAHRRGERVTLFYGSGTKAHKEDFQELVEPALVELVRRHGDSVSVVLMGDIPDSDRLQSIAANVTLLAPVWDIDSYWSVLAAADINIAALKPSLMADGKSEIKWLEAAMLGIPSVVSDTATYQEVIRPGETGFLCSSPEDWIAALDSLVRDPDLRQRIGSQARQHALAAYNPDAMAAGLDRMLRAVSPAPDTRPLILVVNVFYPPQAIGGATRVVHDNVRHLIAQHGGRFRVEVFTSIEGGTPYQLSCYEQDSVRVTGVGTPDDPEIDRRAADERMGSTFAAFLDQVRPALVHFHCIQRLTSSIVTATLDCGIPYLISVHDGWWISDEQFLLDRDGQITTYDYADPITTLRNKGEAAYTRMAQLRRPLFGAAEVLAVSEPFARLYRNRGVPNVVTIANGVSRLPAVTRQPSPNGKVRLAFIGGLARHKGYDLLRIALRSRPFRNLRLLAIDHAMSPGETRRETWGTVEVEFQPKRLQSRVAELYGEIDVLLTPSIWPESYGLVTREALLCGCWVVASDRGSIGEDIVDGENGFVVNVANIDGLVKVLSEFDENPDRYTAQQRVHERLRDAVEQAEDLAQVYSKHSGLNAG